MRILTITLLSLFLLAGCGGEALPLAPVNGEVTLQGVAVPSGVVTFVPDESSGNTGPVATGHLEKDGSFTLKTTGQTGALVGVHRVRIEPYLSYEETLPTVSIPEKFLSNQSTPLSAKVKAGAQNDFKFELGQ